MPGRVPALEVMVNTAAIRECIINENNTADIPDLMAQGGSEYGMQTYDQGIMKLYKQGMISFEDAMNAATNPEDFDLRLKGITGAADRWEDGSAEASPSQSDGKDGQGFSKY